MIQPLIPSTHPLILNQTTQKTVSEKPQIEKPRPGDLELIQTDDPECRTRIYIANYEEWGSSHLTLDQYLERERVLANTPFASSNTHWILSPAPRDQSQKLSNREFLASCETFTRPCIASINGQVIKGDCYSIDSVFTPPEHRRKGYASMLLNRLFKVLEGRALASTLYSDIGPTFYDSKGWKLFSSITYSTAVPALTKDMDMDDGVIEINGSMCESILEKEATLLEKFMESCALKFVNTFALVPVANAQIWQFTRSEFYARVHGFTLSAMGASKDEEFILWAHDFKEGVLLVTYTNTKIYAQPLLNAAFSEARKFGLGRVEVWGSTAEGTGCIAGLVNVMRNTDGFQEFERKDSLNSLAFWGGTSSSFEWNNPAKLYWV